MKRNIKHRLEAKLDDIMRENPKHNPWNQDAKALLYMIRQIFVLAKRPLDMAEICRHTLSPDAAIAALKAIDAKGDKAMKKELCVLMGYFYDFKAIGYMERTETSMRLLNMLHKRGLSGITR
ncbi:MAG: hypothetical protein IAE94_05275 [Chthoniobacterales bacterium]|nr:hypothetical protein [Chthoniobacterales bacterium]